ncbi:MAG: DoxX family protein [Propionibacteriaceae bacterium]|jgi:putative oxidoreductase|nr:DoxX family protein [Propionibacteriaceae bacterium]
MTHTVEDEQTMHQGGEQSRTPRLPEPPSFDDGADERTRVQPAVAAAVEADPPTQQQPVVPDDAIFRAQSVSTPSELSPEEAKLAAERAARREARTQALAQPDVRTIATPEPVVVTRRTTDRFLGAFALFGLRLVVAAIMAIRGLEIVTNLPAAEALFATTIIPEPRITAMVTGGAALAIAVALVFGLLTRVAGLGVLLIASGALAFVQWGFWSPFVPGRSGFIGELELLLAAVGLVFLCVGGGGFSLDRSFRKSREKDRLLDQGL